MDAIFEGATFLDRIDHVGNILLELFRSIEQSQIQGFFSTGIPFQGDQQSDHSFEGWKVAVTNRFFLLGDLTKSFEQRKKPSLVV